MSNHILRILSYLAVAVLWALAYFSILNPTNVWFGIVCALLACAATYGAVLLHFILAERTEA